MSPTKCKENMHSASQLLLNSLSILFLSDIFYRSIYYYDVIYSKNTCYYHHKGTIFFRENKKISISSKCFFCFLVLYMA